MAFPIRSQKDYNALRKGKVRNIFDKARSRARKQELSEKIDKETVVSNEELKRYVDETFREDLRMSAYKTLLAAKDNPRAVIAYYNFVNAFQLDESGEKSYGNICCMALDLAKVLLKK